MIFVHQLTLIWVNFLERSFGKFNLLVAMESNPILSSLYKFCMVGLGQIVEIYKLFTHVP